MGLVDEVVMKIHRGTTRGDVHLCATCRFGVSKRGAASKEDIQLCNGSYGHPVKIHGMIAECSAYYSRSLPTLYDLEQIAWEITSKGNKIGFITPEDRRAAGIGFGTPPPR